MLSPTFGWFRCDVHGLERIIDPIGYGVERLERLAIGTRGRGTHLATLSSVDTRYQGASLLAPRDLRTRALRSLAGVARDRGVDSHPTARWASGERARVGGHVHRMFPERLERDDVQGSGVRGGQDDGRRDAGLICLQPPGRNHTPPVPRTQAGEMVFRSGCCEVIPDLSLVL